MSVCSLENLNVFPTKTSSLYQPHYLPKLDPEDGHLLSLIMEEVSKDNELEKKIKLIMKMLTNWKEVITVNRREDKEKEEMSHTNKMIKIHIKVFEENFVDVSETMERVV